MKLIVTDRESIERGIVVRSSYVVISIRDPGKPRAKVKKTVGLRDVLYLAFHDAEPTQNFALPSEIVLMTEHHARQIWDFVARYKGEVGAIVCQCEQGMSRSPAVAAAVAIKLGVDDRFLWGNFSPNRYVHNKLSANMVVKEHQ